MHAPQLDTLDYLESIAKRDNATLYCDEYDVGSDGSLLVSMAYGVESDHTCVLWTMNRHGELVIH